MSPPTPHDDRIRKGDKLSENPLTRVDALRMIKRRAAGAGLPYFTCWIRTPCEYSCTRSTWPLNPIALNQDELTVFIRDARNADHSR